MAYTKDDLETALAALRREEQRWENYSGNNPNKYRASIRQLRSEVEIIQAELVRSGILGMRPSAQKTSKESLDEVLDKAFPNARSRAIVEHQGKRYQRVFWPLEKSKSGKTVKVWGRGWTPIEE